MPIIELEEGTGRPSWPEYFSAMAIINSSRSSCMKNRAGVVVVDSLTKYVHSTGYNGAPKQLESCREAGKCRKKSDKTGTGDCIGNHAERNGIGHIDKKTSNGIDVYSTIFPCHTCAKDMLPFDLKKVYYKIAYDKEELKPTLDLFEEAGVEVYHLDLSPQRMMEIIFNPAVYEKHDIWTPEDSELVEKLIENFK